MTTQGTLWSELFRWFLLLHTPILFPTVFKTTACKENKFPVPVKWSFQGQVKASKSLDVMGYTCL